VWQLILLEKILLTLFLSLLVSRFYCDLWAIELEIQVARGKQRATTETAFPKWLHEKTAEGYFILRPAVLLKPGCIPLLR
jgi:hypothetical protein